MIGQQLDLFGAPLRPPKKILVDEPPVEEQPAATDISTPAAEAAPVTEELVEETPPVIEPADVFEEAEAVAEDVTLSEEPENELPTESEDSEIIDETEDLSFEIEENVSSEMSPVDAAVYSQERKTKSENGEQQQVVYRGRKTGDPDEEIEMLNVPPDEELFKRQYYSMREAAAMFNVNQALLRFWENEFDILQPKKNKKGDRYFRPIDIKNLVLIYHLLRVRKFTLEGAKDYLHTHQKAADSFQLVQRLEKLKSFLVELKANL